MRPRPTKSCPPRVTLQVAIPGPPFAQPRPRAVRRGKHAGVYDPPDAVRYKKAVARRFLVELARLRRLGIDHGYPAQGPVSVTISAAFPRPASWPRGAPEVAWCQREADDADNVAKAILDAGNGVLWRDDGFVALLLVARVVAPPGHPGVVGVRVEPRAPDDNVADQWWWPSMRNAPTAPAVLARARASRAGPRRMSLDVARRVLDALPDAAWHGPGGTCSARHCRGCDAARVLAAAEPLEWAERFKT